MWSFRCSPSRRIVHFNITLDDMMIMMIRMSALYHRRSWYGNTTPFFSNFLFTYLFSIKFLYFFIISSLFPYFNLFESIFIQSYVNSNSYIYLLWNCPFTSVARLTTVIKMYIYYDKSTCNKNMIRHLPYIRTHVINCK